MAVSVPLGLTIAVVLADQGQLTPREEPAWKAIQSSVVTLYQGTLPKGPAVLIDRSGLFIAHRNSVGLGPSSGRTLGNVELQFSVVSDDEPSQLVLLQAKDWKTETSPRPVSVSLTDPNKGTRLVAVLATGPICAEFVSRDRLAVLRPSGRVMPVNEIRFEAPSSLVAGALVFTLDGGLLGTLSATLGQRPEGSNVSQFQPKTDLTARGGTQFGPSEMTVAYTVGPELLERVIDGFLSPGHQVFHPTVGLVCVDSPGVAGALVQSVAPDSTALRGGIVANDVILDIGNNPIRNQIDFGRVMFRQRVGDKVLFRFRRGDEVRTVELTIGGLSGRSVRAVIYGDGS